MTEMADSKYGAEANLKVRDCPVCATPREQSVIFLPRNIDQSSLTSLSFASRKLPEYMCHQMVKCGSCSLVYVDEMPSDDQLALSYHQADFDSENEANDAAHSYFSSIAPALHNLGRRENALEIGTGTGIFLDYLADAGFTRLVGVEPSQAAIDAAPAYRKDWIVHDIFKEEDFEPESFDAIFCFMTLEHVPDPQVIAAAAHKLLRKGGLFVSVTHNYASPVNRLLGKKSPIIDIEHMQLFSRQSIHKLYDVNGYEEISVMPFWNKYALRYWVRLFPLGEFLKHHLLKWLDLLRLGGVKIPINVGNQIAIGRK